MDLQAEVKQLREGMTPTTAQGGYAPGDRGYVLPSDSSKHKRHPRKAITVSRGLNRSQVYDYSTFPNHNHLQVCHVSTYAR